jgi:hypothetical protein
MGEIAKDHIAIYLDRVVERRRHATRNPTRRF